MILRVKDREYTLATTLRVVYALRDISHANSLQEAIGSISKLDLDGQLSLLYAAYKAGEGRENNALSKTEFVDTLLDNLGIFAITNAINALTDGLLYSGLSQEEIASKKAQVEVAMPQMTATGTHSSAVDINLA